MKQTNSWDDLSFCATLSECSASGGAVFWPLHVSPSHVRVSTETNLRDSPNLHKFPRLLSLLVSASMFIDRDLFSAASDCTLTPGGWSSIASVIEFAVRGKRRQVKLDPRAMFVWRIYCSPGTRVEARLLCLCWDAKRFFTC